MMKGWRAWFSCADRLQCCRKAAVFCYFLCFLLFLRIFFIRLDRLLSGLVERFGSVVPNLREGLGQDNPYGFGPLSSGGMLQLNRCVPWNSVEYSGG
jgi:hypothetical protein